MFKGLVLAWIAFTILSCLERKVIAGLFIAAVCRQGCISREKLLEAAELSASFGLCAAALVWWWPIYSGAVLGGERWEGERNSLMQLWDCRSALACFHNWCWVGGEGPVGWISVHWTYMLTDVSWSKMEDAHWPKFGALSCLLCLSEISMLWLLSLNMETIPCSSVLPRMFLQF